MYTVLLLEQHPMIRKQIKNTINLNLKEITVLEAVDEKEVVEMLPQYNIDLFYIDIELACTNGFELIEKIRNNPKYEFTYVVFITNSIEYLIQPLQKYHCYDFIQKPFQSQQIIKLTKKLLCGPQLELKGEKELYITIQEKTHSINIFIQSIYFIESIRRKVYIHTTRGIIEITAYSLNYIENILLQVKEIPFIRTHKSYIVNGSKIIGVKRDKNISGEIYFYGYDKKAKLGRRFETELNRLFLRVRYPGAVDWK